jgi:hypothetical protein
VEGVKLKLPAVPIPRVAVLPAPNTNVRNCVSIELVVATPTVALELTH